MNEDLYMFIDAYYRNKNDPLIVEYIVNRFIQWKSGNSSVNIIKEIKEKKYQKQPKQSEQPKQPKQVNIFDYLKSAVILIIDEIEAVRIEIFEVIIFFCVKLCSINCTFFSGLISFFRRSQKLRNHLVEYKLF